MDWLAENWLWFLIFGLFIVMHLFGHGSHGKHNKHNDQDKQGNKD